MDFYPEDFEQRLCHRFKDRSLLITALTHSSCAYESSKDAVCNERLEFLGDAVLDFVVGEAIFRRFPDMDEGGMTEMRAAAVCEKALAEYAKQLDLGRYILLGRGEEAAHGERRPSILSDALEAVIAAIYLDRGMTVVKQVILALFAEELHAIDSAEYSQDFKTSLQEKIQELHRRPPTYHVVGEAGPDHDRTFTAEVRLAGRVLGKGSGKSKKQAEQAAARDALDQQPS
jgi:ribonuclease-3